VTLFHDLPAKTDRQMGLPHSRRSEYQHILTMSDEVPCRQFPNQPLVR